MRILFVTTMPVEYGKSCSIRNNALIHGLSELGCKVDLYEMEPNSCFMEYDKSLVATSIVDKKYYIGKDKGASKELKNRKFIFLLRKKISQMIKALSPWDTRYYLIKNEKPSQLEYYYDVVISSSDPISSHYLASKIIENNKNTIGQWIQYWGDPLASDITKNRIGSQDYIEGIEKKILKMSNKIIYLSPFTLNEMKDKYVDIADRMYYFPRPVIGVDINHYMTEDIDYDHLKVGYFGRVYKGRNLNPLYNAIKSSHHSLEIFGECDFDNTNNIKIHQRVSEDICISESMKLDVLVCVCNSSGTQIPGKIYDAAITNKYVMIILDGENADSIRAYFSQFNRFVFCQNNSLSIRDMLDNIKMYNNTRRPCESFDSKIVANSIMEIL